jgi:hypothetical protein
MLRLVLLGSLLGLSACGMGASEFRNALDADVRAQCETCGGNDCAAPPRDTDDILIMDDLCKFHPAKGRACLDAMEALTAADCTDPDGAPGVFALPDACADAFTCDLVP